MHLNRQIPFVRKYYMNASLVQDGNFETLKSSLPMNTEIPSKLFIFLFSNKCFNLSILCPFLYIFTHKTSTSMTEI